MTGAFGRFVEGRKAQKDGMRPKFFLWNVALSGQKTTANLNDTGLGLNCKYQYRNDLLLF